MKLTKTKQLTEAEAFIKKFKRRTNDRIWSLKADIQGNIISIESTDKEILAYVKKLGLE